MSTYDTLRHFADTWGVAFLTLVFLAVVVWVLRPGSRKIYSEQADIPFKYEDSPVQVNDRNPASGGGDRNGQ